MSISRVSTYQVNKSFAKQINNTQSKFNKLSQQIASGKRVTSVAGDPVAARGIIKANKQLSDIEEYQSNIKIADNELSEIDKTLVSVNDQLTRAKDLAMQVANGTLGAEQVKAYQAEIDSIIDNVTKLANTKYKDQYIFAGTRTETIPYSEDNVTGLMYKGDNGKRYAIIDEDKTEQINLLGSEIFGQASFTKDADGKIHFPNPDTDSSGVFGALYHIKAAIQDADNVDSDAVRAAMGDLDKSVEVVIAGSAKVGAQGTSFDDMLTVFDNDSLNIDKLRSNLQDTDLPSAISDWYSVYQSLQGSYSMMSQTMDISLLNYI